VQLLGDLAAGLTAADHEHRAGWKRGRISVVVDVQLKQPGGQRGSGGRPVGPLVGSGREHHAPGPQVALRGGEEEAVLPGAFDGLHLDALAERSADRLRVALQRGDDLVAGHVPVRAVPVVRIARELDGPVWRDQAEAVPAIPPGLTDPASFEDHVLQSCFAQVVADGKAGLSAAHHRHLDALSHFRGSVGHLLPLFLRYSRTRASRRICS
jgi:hypothetical protein